ncbi:MAG: ABC transporter permease [Gammaproteobacteria bacterium]|nr:ABC transporter permease [Gammaproteobacteria bacterium]
MDSWRRNKLAFAILALPPTAWLVIFFTVPLAIMWVYSFAERGPQGQIHLAVSFANYVRAVEWIHLGIIWKSIWIAAVTTLITFVVGFPLAMGIAFAPQRWKNPLLLLVILPFWTNLLIRTYAWIAVLRTRGFLNFGLEWVHEKTSALLALIGLPSVMGQFQPLELLYNQKAVVIGLVYVYLPFLVLPIYTTLEKLDKSYLEASLDLGAGQWRTLRSITMPLAMTGVISGCMLCFILSMGTFLTPELLGGTDSEMIGNLIARQFTSSRDRPFGSALSFLLLYTTFLILWVRASLAGRKGGPI